MTNLNLWEAWTDRPYQLILDEPDGSTNCLTKIKGLLWVGNQPFWTYHCSCCNSYQFKKGKTSSWGEIYD